MVRYTHTHLSARDFLRESGKSDTCAKLQLFGTCEGIQCPCTVQLDDKIDSLLKEVRDLSANRKRQLELEEELAQLYVAFRQSKAGNTA